MKRFVRYAVGLIAFGVMFYGMYRKDPNAAYAIGGLAVFMVAAFGGVLERIERDE